MNNYISFLLIYFVNEIFGEQFENCKKYIWKHCGTLRTKNEFLVADLEHINLKKIKFLVERHLIN